MISVIIPVYNAEQTLGRTLGSILAQTYGDFEIILIDDGSTDGSLLLAQKYAERDKRIIIISKSNGGVSSARNAGLKLAKGEFVQFVDADDDIAPEMFEKMVETATRTNADAVTCRFKHDCWKPYLPAGEYRMDSRKDALTFFTDFFTFNVPWNKLIRRSQITKGFDESFKIFEDGLFFLENMGSIKKVVVLEDEFYNYFNASGAANSAVNAFLKTRFWETKSGYWFKQLLIKKPFEDALEGLGFERPESFIRTRMFDMAFVELVKLIHSDISEEYCTFEMFTIFSQPEFADSLKLFGGKHFEITFENTADFVKNCFAAFRQVSGGARRGELFFEYIDFFFAAFSGQRLAIFDIISKKFLGGGKLNLVSQSVLRV